MCKLSLTTREARYEYFLGPNRVRREVVTPGVLQYYHLHISMDLSNPSMNLIRPPQINPS
jgi:hypothetical protein